MAYRFILFLFILTVFSSCFQSKPSENKDVEEAIPTHIVYEGNSDMPHIALVSGDEEYRSEEALPMLARILNEHHGFTCTVLFAQDPEKPGLIDPNYGEHIPHLDILNDVDGMILFTRFRALPNEQMRHFDNFLKDGKPLIGIRTATHAFHFPDDYPDSTWRHYTAFYEGDEDWEGGFGRRVLGETWRYHHGYHQHQSTRGKFAPDAHDHPVLSGISDEEIWGSTDVYGIRLPQPEGSQALVLGQVINRAGEYDADDLIYGMRPTDNEVAKTNPKREDIVDVNDPMMPIVWTKPYMLPGGAEGIAFTSTIGSSTDLLNAGLRRLIVNATYWMTGHDVPAAAQVDIVGDYTPTAYKFVDDSYWQEKQLMVSDYVVD